MPDDTTVEMTEEQKEIITAAQKCLKGYQDRENDNINRAEDAIRFRAGEQWPDRIRQDRENPDQEGGARPCPVLDKTNQYVHQIINEERLNRAAIKYRPVDDAADEKTAEIYTGITRHIEDASEAIEAYTTAGEHAIDGGFGYFRILADYCDPMSFDQDIRIKRIHNRFSVALGPHTEVDGSDAREAVIWEDMARDDFEKEFPGAKVVDFTESEGWADEDTVRVGEYMCIEDETTKIHMMEDGTVFTDEDLKQLMEEADEAGIEVPEPIDTRETILNQVKWYKLTAEEILDEKDLPGQWIPVIKVTGEAITMPDGKIRVCGAIEPAMDAQRLHNYSHAGYIEHVALAPRAPWIAEEDQVEGYENEYANANRLPITLLKYKSVSVDGHLLPPPNRTPAEGVPIGWHTMLQNTEHGVEAAFGMYGPSIGAQSAERSGIALQEQKQQGAVGQFHFPDNLARSIQHCGRIMLEWIPVYYDTERMARILGEDGTQQLVQLNPMQETSVMDMVDEVGRATGKSYNLNVGKYDVTVTTGPSYSSKRQEAVDTQTQIIQAAPDLLPIIGDILFDNMEAPGSDKIAERIKIALLPPEIRQAEEQQDEGIDPKVAAMMQQIDQASQALDMKAQELAQIEQQINQAATEANADKTQVDAARKELEAARKVFMSEIKVEESELQLKAMQIKQDMGEGLSGSDEVKIIVKELEEAYKNARFEREMALKEQEIGIKESPRDAALNQSLASIGERLEEMREDSKKPRPFPKIDYDDKGEMIGVNGQPFDRNERGDILGLKVAEETE